jgi:hypothetical protein
VVQLEAITHEESESHEKHAHSVLLFEFVRHVVSELLTQVRRPPNHRLVLVSPMSNVHELCSDAYHTKGTSDKTLQLVLRNKRILVESFGESKLEDTLLLSWNG